MGVPQIIWITLLSANLLLTAYLHGKPREGKYNIWGALFVAVITFWILKAGGFFG